MTNDVHPGHEMAFVEFPVTNSSFFARVSFGNLSLSSVFFDFCLTSLGISYSYCLTNTVGLLLGIRGRSQLGVLTDITGVVVVVVEMIVARVVVVVLAVVILVDAVTAVPFEGLQHTLKITFML